MIHTLRYLALFLIVTTSTIGFSQNRGLSERFFENNPTLDVRVDSIYRSLSDDERVAQLIMQAVGKFGTTEDTIKMLIKANKIGGVLLLNGTKEQFAGWTTSFEALNEELGHLPFLYSADAEPSLVNRKMIGSTPVKKAIEIETLDELTECASTIANDLLATGVNYNFAPVVDVSSNKTVGYRGFGKNPKNIIPFSIAFIEETQAKNIIATAKHFPGHGLVSGDTHHSLQAIDGEMKELGNYPPLIDKGVLSIMIAHIAVKNNEMYSTNGAPATTSRAIVTDLLKDSLGFEGLIVTDAMNMGGVVKVKDAYVKAIDAGCDILLMPVNAFKAHAEIKAKMEIDTYFKARVEESARKIIRMKLCLGLL